MVRTLWRVTKISLLSLLGLLVSAALGFAAAITLSPVAALAENLVWKDAQGNPVPDRPSQKSVNGVGGWLLVTPDEDWEAKWNTPHDNIPKFREADTVAIGQHLFILIFIAGPTRDKSGDVKITCDIEVQRPNHTYSTRESDLACLTGPLQGPQYTLFLSQQILGFVGEKTDPPGKWLVRIVLKDTVKHVIIPLETSFTLQ
jgi:hypothetical protein